MKKKGYLISILFFTLAPKLAPKPLNLKELLQGGYDFSYENKGMHVGLGIKNRIRIDLIRTEMPPRKCKEILLSHRIVMKWLRHQKIPTSTKHHYLPSATICITSMSYIINICILTLIIPIKCFFSTSGL